MRHKLILPEDVIRAKENIQSYILYGHGKWILHKHINIHSKAIA